MAMAMPMFGRGRGRGLGRGGGGRGGHGICGNSGNRARGPGEGQASSSPRRGGGRGGGLNEIQGEPANQISPRNDQVGEEDEVEDYYERLARLNPVDNRTGRRTRRRSGPGSPTPESRAPVDLEALREIPNTYNGIPRFPPIVAYPANPDGTLDPDVVRLMAERNSPGFANRMQREIMYLVQKPGTHTTMIGEYLQEQSLNGNRDRFFKGKGRANVGMAFQLKAALIMEEDILESIACSVCFDVGLVPLYSCKNEHIVCWSCRDNLQDQARRSGVDVVCPTCRQPGLPANKETIKEAWAQYINVQCGYHHLGCTSKGRIAAMKKHKKESCTVRSWPCYFCDIRITLGTFEPHFYTHHYGNFQDYLSFDSIEDVFKSIVVPLKGDQCGLAFIKIKVAGEGIFVLTQVEVQVKKFIYFVFKVDSKVKVQYEKYKMNGLIRFSSPECPAKFRRQKWSSDVLGGQTRFGKILQHLDVSLPEVEHWRKSTLELERLVESLEEENPHSSASAASASWLELIDESNDDEGQYGCVLDLTLPDFDKTIPKIKLFFKLEKVARRPFF